MLTRPMLPLLWRRTRAGKCGRGSIIPQAEHWAWSLRDVDWCLEWSQCTAPPTWTTPQYQSTTLDGDLPMILLARQLSGLVRWMLFSSVEILMKLADWRTES